MKKRKWGKMSILSNRTCKNCRASYVPKWKEQFSCSECLDELHINSIKKKVGCNDGRERNNNKVKRTK